LLRAGQRQVVRRDFNVFTGGLIHGASPLNGQGVAL
jgi:hypothetical protein